MKLKRNFFCVLTMLFLFVLGGVANASALSISEQSGVDSTNVAEYTIDGNYETYANLGMSGRIIYNLPQNASTVSIKLSSQGGMALFGAYFEGDKSEEIFSINQKVSDRTYSVPQGATKIIIHSASSSMSSCTPSLVWEVTVKVKPASVSDFTCTSGNAKVNLSWTASQDATSYNIKRAATPGGPYTTLATTSSSIYTDTTVSNGTPYYYVVSAVNANGESSNSKEVSATPQNPDVTLEVMSVDKATIGDKMIANVVIHNAKNICAEDIKLVFDTTRLEFVSAEGADGIKIYKETDVADGIKRYITASLGKSNAANGDKVLIKLTFNAKAVGDAKIDITNGRIADNATLEEDIKEKNCGEKIITIEWPKDVNRSGEYTLLDLGIDAWYYGSDSSATDTTKYNADQDSNGKIDDVDLSQIVSEMLNNTNYPANK